MVSIWSGGHKEAEEKGSWGGGVVEEGVEGSGDVGGGVEYDLGCRGTRSIEEDFQFVSSFPVTLTQSASPPNRSEVEDLFAS